MIYAIPSRNLQVANHFSRTPQVVIVDDQRNTQQLITLVETPSQCGKKKQWMEIIKAYNVEAVVVRSIGKKMLKRLFDNKLNVLISPPKMQISELDYASLEMVKSLEYGKEPKKQSACCGSKKPTPTPSTLLRKPKLNLSEMKRGVIKRISQ